MLFVLIPIVFILVMLFGEWMSETTVTNIWGNPIETVRIKFSSFKSFYSVNPGAWRIYDGFVYKEDVGTFSFGFLDYYQFVLWRNKIRKEEKKNRDANTYDKLVQSVEAEKAEEAAFQKALAPLRLADIPDQIIVDVD